MRRSNGNKLRNIGASLPRLHRAIPKYLCKIVDSFVLKNVGTVIVIEKEEEWRIPSNEKICMGEAIRILRPDGSFIRTHIRQFEFIRTSMDCSSLTFVLPEDVSLEEVPKGAQVFLERESAEPILFDRTAPPGME